PFVRIASATWARTSGASRSSRAASSAAAAPSPLAPALTAGGGPDRPRPASADRPGPPPPPPPRRPRPPCPPSRPTTPAGLAAAAPATISPGARRGVRRRHGNRPARPVLALLTDRRVPQGHLDHHDGQIARRRPHRAQPGDKPLAGARVVADAHERTHERAEV